MCLPVWPLSQRLEGNVGDSCFPLRFHIAQTLKMVSLIKENLFLTQAIRFGANNRNTDLVVLAEGFISGNKMI